MSQINLGDIYFRIVNDFRATQSSVAGAVAEVEAAKAKMSAPVSIPVTFQGPTGGGGGGSFSGTSGYSGGGQGPSFGPGSPSGPRGWGSVFGGPSSVSSANSSFFGASGFGAVSGVAFPDARTASFQAMNDAYTASVRADRERGAMMSAMESRGFSAESERIRSEAQSANDFFTSSYHDDRARSSMMDRIEGRGFSAESERLRREAQSSNDKFLAERRMQASRDEMMTRIEQRGSAALANDFGEGRGGIDSEFRRIARDQYQSPFAQVNEEEGATGGRGGLFAGFGKYIALHAAVAATSMTINQALLSRKRDRDTAAAISQQDKSNAELQSYKEMEANVESIPFAGGLGVSLRRGINAMTGQDNVEDIERDLRTSSERASINEAALQAHRQQGIDLRTSVLVNDSLRGKLLEQQLTKSEYIAQSQQPIINQMRADLNDAPMEQQAGIRQTYAPRIEAARQNAEIIRNREINQTQKEIELKVRGIDDQTKYLREIAAGTSIQAEYNKAVRDRTAAFLAAPDADKARVYGEGSAGVDVAKRQSDLAMGELELRGRESIFGIQGQGFSARRAGLLRDVNIARNDEINLPHNATREQKNEAMLRNDTARAALTDFDTETKRNEERLGRQVTESQTEFHDIAVSGGQYQAKVDRAKFLRDEALRPENLGQFQDQEAAKRRAEQQYQLDISVAEREKLITRRGLSIQGVSAGYDLRAAQAAGSRHFNDAATINATGDIVSQANQSMTAIGLENDPQLRQQMGAVEVVKLMAQKQTLLNRFKLGHAETRDVYAAKAEGVTRTSGTPDLGALTQTINQLITVITQVSNKVGTSAPLFQ